MAWIATIRVCTESPSLACLATKSACCVQVNTPRSTSVWVKTTRRAALSCILSYAPITSYPAEKSPAVHIGVAS